MPKLPARAFKPFRNASIIWKFAVRFLGAEIYVQYSSRLAIQAHVPSTIDGAIRPLRTCPHAPVRNPLDRQDTMNDVRFAPRQKMPIEVTRWRQWVPTQIHRRARLTLASIQLWRTPLRRHPIRPQFEPMPRSRPAPARREARQA